MARLREDAQPVAHGLRDRPAQTGGAKAGLVRPTPGAAVGQFSSGEGDGQRR